MYQTYSQLQTGVINIKRSYKVKRRKGKIK